MDSFRACGRAVVLLLLILLGINGGCDAAFAVEAPPIATLPLPGPSSEDEKLDYFGKYLLGNTYKLIEAENYYQAQLFIERALNEQPRNVKFLRIIIHMLARLEYWPELEKRLTQLLEIEPEDQTALMWRGYVRFLMRMGAGSQKDLEKLFSLHPDPQTRAYAEELLAEVRDFNRGYEQAAAEQWSSIRSRIEELEKRDDLPALEAYYEELAQQPGFRLFAIASRGFARLKHNHIEEAEADFDLVLASPDLDAKARADIELALVNIRTDRQAAAEWEEVEKTIADLEEKGDLAGLEQFYTGLAGKEKFRDYALSSRGFVRLSQGRVDEAREDLSRALEGGELDDDSRADIESALARMNADQEAAAEWADIRNTVRELEEKGDAEALERFYGELIQSDKYQSYAMTSRAFLRMRRGMLREAQEALEEALQRGDLDPAVKAEIASALDRIAADRKQAEEWNDIQRRVAELEAAGDVKGLENLYAELSARDMYKPYAITSRGFLRLRDGRTEEAKADFTLALTLDNLGAKAHADIKAMLVRMEEQAAADREWQQVRENIARLEAAGDKQALERYLDELIGKPRFRAYALTSRGFLMLGEKRLGAAERDFQEALKIPSLDRKPRTDIRRSLARLKAERKAKELETAGDLAVVERYYSKLYEHPEFRAYAIISRGYLRLGQGRVAEAEADFHQALVLPDLPESSRREVEETLASIENERQTEREWRQVTELVKRLEKSDDAQAIEDELTRVIEGRQRNNPYAYAMRGLNRIGLARYAEAHDDLTKAQTLGNLAADYRKLVDNTKEELDANLAAGTTPANPRAAAYFQRVNEHLGKKEYEVASSALAQSGKLDLSDSQNGVYLYYLAELEWAAECFDKAYPLYCSAVEQLTDKMLLSEAWWKMSEYHQKRNERELAIRYARQSVSLAPDTPWRNVQLGYMFYGYKMNKEAVFYFEQALATGKLDEQERGFYQSLATAYLRLGDRERFHYYMERHIDKNAAKVAMQAEPAREDVEAWYGAKQYHTVAPKRMRGYLYLFGSRFDNGDYLIQNLNEIYFRVTSFNTINVEVYFQTVGALASSFSGTYYNTWAGGYESYSGKSDFVDTIKVTAGVRATLYAGWSLALDRVFKIGRDTESDVRLRLGYYWGHGTEWQPMRQSWNYAMLYSDAVYSLEHSDFTYFGEAKAGRSYALDRVADKLVATPFVGMTVSGSGKETVKSERWGVEAGPGISLRKWVREDQYHAPQASWEAIVQYRFGLTHKRKDVLSFTLSHIF